MIMFKSTHARTVAAKDAEIASLRAGNIALFNRITRIEAAHRAEVETLRKGGPRGNGGKFVKRVNG